MQMTSQTAAMMPEPDGIEREVISCALQSMSEEREGGAAIGIIRATCPTSAALAVRSIRE